MKHVAAFVFLFTMISLSVWNIGRLEKKINSLEHAQETSGIIINGMDYQVIPYLFPTNAVEYFKNPPPQTP